MPVKPRPIFPASPAMNNPPANEPPPVTGFETRRMRQGARRLPATSNAPSRNIIAQFNGKSGDATSRRISQSILDGQRAQAQLLLASLSGGNGKAGKADHANNKTGAAPVPSAQLRQTQPIAQQVVEATMRTIAVLKILCYLGAFSIVILDARARARGANASDQSGGEAAA